METLSTAAQGDNSGTNPSSVKSDDSSPRHEGGRGSPPPNCAICLGTCRNKSFTDSCLHQFCFKCLLTWSKVKAECPLCKQNFRSIIHNVQSNHQYEEYMVEQHHVETTERLDIDTLTATTRRFRYRTTLTLPRRDSIAIQQLLVQYPMVADVLPPPAPRAPNPRRSPNSFRRTVYRHNLWARPLPDFTGRFRDCTPEFYRYNDSQMHRLVPWLNRELHYLLNENIGHISYVLTRILELLPQYHINSPEFREAMHRYFGERTDHFLHELYCFASTPYDMTGYDRNVQYTTDTRISTMVNEVISSSDSDSNTSVDSDIVMVSHSQPAEPPAGPSRVPAPVYPLNYIPPPANNVIPIETISHSDTDDDSSEVMVVGYIKPPQDRTPEVVDLLGSDSDVIVQDSTQPEPAQTSSVEARTPPLPEVAYSGRPTLLHGSNLVKLSLKRHRSPDRPDSESDTGSIRPRPPRRKRRVRSRGDSTTSDTCRTTPSPASSWSDTPSPSPSPPLTTPDTTEFSDTTASSSTLDRRRRHPKKKGKRKSHKETRTKKKSKKRSRSRSHQRDKRSRNSSMDDKDRRSKRKSRSGKGVKSSKRVDETSGSTTEPVQSAVPEHERAGPSGVVAARNSKRRPSDRESRRLRSVVNVMYGNKNSCDSSTSGGSGPASTFNNSIANTNSCGSTVEEDRTSNSASVVTENTADTSVQSSEAKTKCSNSDTDSEDNLPIILAMYRMF